MESIHIYSPLLPPTIFFEIKNLSGSRIFIQERILCISKQGTGNYSDIQQGAAKRKLLTKAGNGKKCYNQWLEMFCGSLFLRSFFVSVLRSQLYLQFQVLRYTPFFSIFLFQGKHIWRRFNALELEAMFKDSDIFLWKI